MTYKKFVEISVDRAALDWMHELCGEGYHIYSNEVRLERSGDDITYEVDVVVVKENSSYIRKVFTVGGAIGECTGICNSVVFGGYDKYGCREIVWGHSKELREVCGITAERFIPC